MKNGASMSEAPLVNPRGDANAVRFLEHVHSRHPGRGGAVAVQPVRAAHCFAQHALDPITQGGSPSGAMAMPLIEAFLLSF